MNQAQQQPPNQELLSVKEFFEKVPPGRAVPVKDIRGKLVNQFAEPNRNLYLINLPVLELHCGTDSCGGNRLFEAIHDVTVCLGIRTHEFVWYKCRNCEGNAKTYALWIFANKQDNNGNVYKFGEIPQFGPRTPARVISLIRDEMDYYAKGRRAENQGMGIAAFAYYRRVVENQKDKILDEIIRVAGKIGASQKMLEHLNTAK